MLSGKSHRFLVLLPILPENQIPAGLSNRYPNQHNKGIDGG
jgi:hypothetical protein